MFIDLWIFYEMNLARHRYGTSKLWPVFRKVYKDEFSTVFVDYNNCPILLYCFTFPIFYKYMISWKILKSNIGNSNSRGTQQVEEK